jgi:hypothetical protein
LRQFLPSQKPSEAKWNSGTWPTEKIPKKNKTSSALNSLPNLSKSKLTVQNLKPKCWNFNSSSLTWWASSKASTTL